MKRSTKRRVLALLLAVVMVVGLVPAGLTLKTAKAADNVYTFESKDLAAAAQGAYTDGQAVSAGTDNYFTLYMSSKTKLDESTKTWSDDYTSSQRLSFGGKADATTPKNVIKFTTTAATAKVKIWWVKGDADRQIAIYDAAGAEVTKTADVGEKNAVMLSELTLEAAGTYFLGGDINNNYIFKVEVEEVVTSVDYAFESKDMEITAQGAYADGQAVGAGTDNYFTLYMSSKTKIDESTKTWSDEYTSSQRLSFGGKADATTPKNVIKFTTTAATAKVKIWWVKGDADRQMAIYDATGAEVAKTADVGEKNAVMLSELTLEAAGTYFLGGDINNNYIFKVQVTESSATGPVAPEVPGNGKIDILDFGVEAFDAEKYNNLLTVDKVNAIYTGVAAGTSGVTIPGDFSFKDADGNDFFTFCAGGKTNHRWRTTNTAITYYDSKSLKDADGNVYSGYIYSNAGNTDTVYMTFYLYENDILNLWVGSNGAASEYSLMSPSETVQKAEFTNAAKIEKITFYAAEEGVYKLWCSANEKLVVARATREHTNPVKVSGVATYKDVDNTGVVAPTGYKIAFTNEQTGAVIPAKVAADGSYSVYLYDQYTYSMSLLDANGYVINSTDPTLTLAKGAGDTVQNVEVKPVKVATVTGNIVGLSADALAKLKMNFASNEVYVPEMEINSDGTFTLKLEENIEYSVEAVDVNDYTLSVSTFKVTTSSSTADFTFTAKPTYSVTVDLKEISDADKAHANITFTNINEKYSDGKTAYSYTFAATDSIKLRDGQYKVTVSGLGNLPVVQAPTADVKVNGAATSTTVKFRDVEVWDFGKLGATNSIDVIGSDKYFVGLQLSPSAVSENKEIYLLVNEGGTVKFPVKAGDVVTLKYCYQAAFEIDGKAYTSASGSTSKIETMQVTATADGYMTITGVKTTDEATQKEVKQTYFTYIGVEGSDEYRDTLYVGKDKEFKTINDALDAIAKMDRPNSERVTIMIDPGNYEEMLVINDKNITLKNASATPSLALKDKGVNIDENAVRITSYYGHGYTYYSMGSDCKYDEELLAANKANGYPSFVNPGTGKTSGSYWNATVVVYADGFAADGIIFENSFNQYVSNKAANDIIVADSGAKEGSVPRAELEAGSVKVQDKEYVERAAALAVNDGVKEADFLNCKFIGRQDTLYGGVGTTAVFEECEIYGGTDYIMGGMQALFFRCKLVANTSDTTAKGIKDDNFYITAPQQSSGRGFFFYECTVTSTTPGVDTASTMQSKPGYWGRPWAPSTGEAVFYKTTVETTNFSADGAGTGNSSLIVAEGWLSTLSGESALCGEYGTIDKAGATTDGRVAWATVFTEPVLADGTEMKMASFVEATWLAELLAAARLGNAADYTAVDAAIAAANALKAEDYKDFSAVTAALNAVKQGLTADKQSEVDAMAKAITDAIAALEAKTPDTGDSSATFLYVIMLVAAFAAVAVVVFDKKRRNA